MSKVTFVYQYACSLNHTWADSSVCTALSVEWTRLTVECTGVLLTEIWLCNRSDLWKWEDLREVGIKSGGRQGRGDKELCKGLEASEELGGFFHSQEQKCQCGRQSIRRSSLKPIREQGKPQVAGPEAESRPHSLARFPTHSLTVTIADGDEQAARHPAPPPPALCCNNQKSSFLLWSITPCLNSKDISSALTFLW